MVAPAATTDLQALRKQYLAFFPAKPSDIGALKAVVSALVASGVDRRTLTTWAVNAGYSLGYVRSLLCRIFRALGLRERNVGAGRKPSREARELLGYARRRYGNDVIKVLRAALRMGEAQMKAEEPGAQAGLGRLGANCDLQLNCDPQSYPPRISSWRTGTHPNQYAQKIFNRTSQFRIKVKTPSPRKRL